MADEDRGTGLGAETRTPAEWAVVCETLRAEIGEAAFQSWIKPMRMVGRENGRLRLSVPTRFMRDWVVAHYADRLTDLWRERADLVDGVDILVQAEQQAQAKAAAAAASVADVAAQSGEAAAQTSPGGATAMSSGPAQTLRMAEQIGAPLDQRFTFDRFVVGKPNEFAYAAARRVAEADAVPFNPLFL